MDSKEPLWTVGSLCGRLGVSIYRKTCLSVLYLSFFFPLICCLLVSCPVPSVSRVVRNPRLSFRDAETSRRDADTSVVFDAKCHVDGLFFANELLSVSSNSRLLPFTHAACVSAAYPVTRETSAFSENAKKKMENKLISAPPRPHS